MNFFKKEHVNSSLYKSQQWHRHQVARIMAYDVKKLRMLTYCLLAMGVALGIGFIITGMLFDYYACTLGGIVELLIFPLICFIRLRAIARYSAIQELINKPKDSV